MSNILDITVKVDFNADKLLDAITEGGKKGLRSGLGKVAAGAREQVPFSSGDLCAKIDVFEDGDKQGVRATGDYALIQHENTDFRHPNPKDPHSRAGRKPKYLEDPFNAAQNELFESAADGIKSKIGD